LGFYYGSDTRGTGPFMPVCNAELVACPQVPTTLPTFPECLAVEGYNIEDALARLLSHSVVPAAVGHVYSGNARLEGVKWAGTFERLLAGVRDQGHEPVALGAYADGIDAAHLPRHVVVAGAIDGRRAPLALQGKEFLS
ncbi:MAG: 4-deoxy-4-formamido-L-arabinose-phosphoundecaprenol deformylase, partial [Betaproteobacteria bacterium]|nr:4-deoxy-4-formamido-L-arabinose-phosphoundecaprenol deformylase [Betaproteobacteria bacterium]